MWRFYLFAVWAIGLAVLPAAAAEMQKAEVLKINDGDTVRLAVNGTEIKLRLSDIDCFENKRNIRQKWQAEIYGLTETEVLHRGEHSAGVLTALLQENREFVYVTLNGKDVYRRYLGTLWIVRDKQALNVNRYMLEQGGCVSYLPKPRRWKPKRKTVDF